MTLKRIYFSQSHFVVSFKKYKCWHPNSVDQTLSVPAVAPTSTLKLSREEDRVEVHHAQHLPSFSLVILLSC